MNKENELIRNLCDLNNEAFENKEKCISIYHTFSNLEDAIVQREIKSLCRQLLQNSEVKDLDKVIADICEIIIKNVLIQKRVKPGIAIFFKFNPITFDKKNLELNSHNLNIHFSNFKPQTKTFFGDIFDLSTVSAMISNKNSLFINVSYGDTKIYSYSDGEINLIKEIENKIDEKFEDRFTNIQKTAPGIGSGGVQASSGKAQEKRTKFSRKIINDMIDEVKRISNNPKGYRQLLIVVSPDFSNDREHIIDSLKSLSELEPFVKQENIDYDKDQDMKVRKIVLDIENNFTDSEINEAKTRIDRVLQQSLNSVCEYIRAANVYKIFIREGFEAPGFILNNELVYPEKFDGAIKTPDIVPRLIKRVLDVDGSVDLLNKEDNRINEGIALIPRY